MAGQVDAPATRPATLLPFNGLKMPVHSFMTHRVSSVLMTPLLTRKGGCMCPRSGSDCAARMRGWALAGPGLQRVRESRCAGTTFRVSGMFSALTSPRPRWNKGGGVQPRVSTAHCSPHQKPAWDVQRALDGVLVADRTHRLRQEAYVFRAAICTEALRPHATVKGHGWLPLLHIWSIAASSWNSNSLKNSSSYQEKQLT